MARYRGESGVLEYSVGGMISGALYRFSLGPKGMISGGFFGGVLGTFGGLLMYAVLKIGGDTMEDIYRQAQLYFVIKDANFHGAARVSDDCCAVFNFDICF